MKKTIQQSHNGFTLIETLVAIFIFSTALVALSAIAARGVSSVNRAKEVVSAQFLAQEGLEMTRNVRDNATLEAIPDWDIYFQDCLLDNPCGIDYSSSIPQLIPCGSSCDLWLDNGIFVFNPSSSAVPTNFTRRIWVVPTNTPGANPPVEYVVHSRVMWAVGNGSNRSVEAVSTLSDWQ